LYWLIDIDKATLINKILMASIPLLGLRYVISAIANIEPVAEPIKSAP
jgi:hypothetical protein